jgi:DNA-binding protein H-NS
MAKARGGRQPVRIEVEAKRVEGTIELAEIARRLERNAVADARQAKRDPDVTQEVEDRLRNIGRLARELAGELELLEAARSPKRKKGPGRGPKKA